MFVDNNDKSDNADDDADDDDDDDDEDADADVDVVTIREYRALGAPSSGCRYSVLHLGYLRAIQVVLQSWELATSYLVSLAYHPPMPSLLAPIYVRPRCL